MKDTLVKLRALISMKSCLIDALRADVGAAAAKIDVLTSANHALCQQNKWLIKRKQQLEDQLHALEQEKQQWWSQQDDDKEWIDVQVNMDKEKNHA